MEQNCATIKACTPVTMYKDSSGGFHDTMEKCMAANKRAANKRIDEKIYRESMNFLNYLLPSIGMHSPIRAPGYYSDTDYIEPQVYKVMTRAILQLLTSPHIRKRLAIVISKLEDYERQKIR